MTLIYDRAAGGALNPGTHTRVLPFGSTIVGADPTGILFMVRDDLVGGDELHEFEVKDPGAAFSDDDPEKYELVAVIGVGGRAVFERVQP